VSVNGLVLLDLETTGLDETQGVIIELGIRVVDADFNPVSEFHSYVLGDEEVEFIQKKWREDDYAYRMHKKNGLIDILERLIISGETDLLSRGEVEWKAVSWLKEQGLELNSTEPLAGSSVHFDRKWLLHHMPMLHDAFGYRNIDASSFMEYARKFTPGRAAQVEQDTRPHLRKTHRVMDDLLDTATLFWGLRKNGVIA